MTPRGLIRVFTFTPNTSNIENIKEVYVKDNEWFTMDITVQDKQVTVKINYKIIVNYTETNNVKRGWATNRAHCRAARSRCRDTARTAWFISGISW